MRNKVERLIKRSEKIEIRKFEDHWSRVAGPKVSMLAFYSDDPSSNPAEVYSFVL